MPIWDGPGRSNEGELLTWLTRYRYLGRLREIINVFAREGFGYLIDQVGLGHLIPWPRRVANPPDTATVRGERLRRALESLGPTFIKLGQVMSTRPDLLPPDVVQSLRRLQDEVAPFPYSRVEEQVAAELGAPIEQVFASFDPSPLAAASIGQVHRACLQSGEEVVVKVQRPRLTSIVETDLAILFDVARLAQNHTPWGEFYNFVDLVEEFARTIREEMDFAQEGRNADRLRQNLQQFSRVRIPTIYWEYTTTRLLVLEYVEGLKINNLAALEREGIDRHALAEDIIQVFLHQIFINGFFHADPHPGNMAVQAGGILVLMDFGMVSRLSPERREQLSQLIMGLLQHNSRQIVKTILEMGLLPPGLDVTALRRAVDRLRDKYYTVPFHEIDLGQAITEILELAFQFHITLPAEFSYLAKVLITLEGLTLELDPDLSIVQVAEPLGREILRSRWQPPALRSKLRDYLRELVEVPQQLKDIIDQLAAGSLRVRLDHEGLDKVMARLSRVAAQLSLSLVLLSFSIVMSGLVISSALGQDTGSLFFWRLPVLEIGFVAATVMAMWLVWSIFRSGRS